MKVPWITRPFAPSAVAQGGVVTAASQQDLAKRTASVAARTCASRWCKTFADPDAAPIAELTNHTTDVKFQVGSIFGTLLADFGMPWLHQAGQYGIVVDVTLVCSFPVVLGFRFSADDWLTSGAVAQKYSAYVTGKPWEPVQHELWVRKQWSDAPSRAVTLTAELKSPNVPNSVTDRSVLLEFFVRPETNIVTGPFDFSGNHVVRISDLRIYDTLSTRSYP